MGELIIIGTLALAAFVSLAAVAGDMLLDTIGCQEAGMLKVISVGVVFLTLLVLGLVLIGFILKQVGALL